MSELRGGVGEKHALKLGCPNHVRLTVGLPGTIDQPVELGRVLPGVHLSLSVLHIHHKGLEKWGAGFGVGVVAVTWGGG